MQKKSESFDCLVLETPVVLRVPELMVCKITDFLRYEDKSITYEWLKYKKIQEQDNLWVSCSNPGRARHWFVVKNGREALDFKVSQLNAERFKSLLFRDEKGYWTFSGLASKLSKLLEIPIVREYELPEFGLVPWAHKPPFEPRWYQTKAVELLVPDDRTRGHGAIQHATGMGKSLTIALLLKKMGLPAVIMVPTLSIGEQLFKNLTDWFGKDKVGRMYDGKKHPEKMFVVAVSASLVRVKEGTKEYKALREKKVLVCDESHLVPAQSLAKVALELLKDLPYRFFLSGTQIRNDGLDLLLDGIIGDVLMDLSVRDGIEQGFLAPLRFFQWNITSDSKFDSDDAIKMNRHHLHANKKVNKHAVMLAKYGVAKGRRVLILIEEIDQFIKLMDAGLLDGLRVAFAHGGLVEPEHKNKIPAAFHKSCPTELVEKFDAGEYDVLVGTSCIQTGTDIKSVDCIINCVGLTSEIQVRQGVAGRGTRLFEGKVDCMVHDYNVFNIKKLEKHAKIRRKILNDIYGPVTIKEAIV